MNTTADSTRHIKTIRRGEKAWHWTALYVGHVQPVGFRNFRRGRRCWQLHLTPVHASRDGEKWTVGLCFGRRTVFVYRHR